MPKLNLPQSHPVAVLVTVARKVDIIRPACRICIGRESHLWLRLLIGFALMTAGILTYQNTEHFSAPVRVLGDMVGFLVHSVGLAPWIDAAAILGGVTLEGEA